MIELLVQYDWRQCSSDDIGRIQKETAVHSYIRFGRYCLNVILAGFLGLNCTDDQDRAGWPNPNQINLVHALPHRFFLCHAFVSCYKVEGEELLALCATLQLQDHHLSAVRD